METSHLSNMTRYEDEEKKKGTGNPCSVEMVSDAQAYSGEIPDLSVEGVHLCGALLFEGANPIFWYQSLMVLTTAAQALLACICMYSDLSCGTGPHT